MNLSRIVCVLGLLSAASMIPACSAESPIAVREPEPRANVNPTAPDAVITDPAHQAVVELLRGNDAASPTVFLKPSTDSSITIVFHTRWNDANGNRTINTKEELLSELEGVKSHFARDENICIALFFLGLDGADVRFDLLDLNGVRLLKNDVPIDGNGVFVYRQIAAGMLPEPSAYVFRWYLNGEVIHSTLVQIVPGGTASARSPL